MITRRVFVKRLSVVLPIFAFGHKNNSTNHKIKLTTLKVAGVQYGKCASDNFSPTEILDYRREKENIYDSYAVALYSRGKKVGYIPKENSRIIASLLDYGTVLHIEVRYFDETKEPWKRLWVSVYQVG